MFCSLCAAQFDSFFLFRLVGSDVDILPPSVSSCGSDGQRPVLASVPDPVRVVFVSLAASIASSVAGSNFEKNLKFEED